MIISLLLLLGSKQGNVRAITGGEVVHFEFFFSLSGK